MINVIFISKDGIVNIFYVFKISDDEMVCFLDGEYFCDLEFLDDVIQKIYVKGVLVVFGKIDDQFWFWFFLFNIFIF